MPKQWKNGTGMNQAVGGREVHAVADALAVVDDIVVGQHDAFGETGRARSVLHVDDFIFAEGSADFGDPLGRDRLAHFDQLLPGEATMLVTGEIDHVAQHRQAAAVQVAGLELGFGQLRADFVHDRHIIGVLEAIHHDQDLGVGLAQQIFSFVDLVRGVDRDQYGTDAGTGKKGQQPLRMVCRPDRDMVAFANADRQQAAGGLIDIVKKFAVRAGIVECRVFQRILVWKFAGDVFDEFPERQVDHRVLGKQGLTGWLYPCPCLRAAHDRFGRQQAQPFACGLLDAHVLVHRIGEGREDDRGIFQIAAPAFDPFEGDKAVVAVFIEQVKGFENRQIAVAQHPVAEFAIDHD